MRELEGKAESTRMVFVFNISKVVKRREADGVKLRNGLSDGVFDIIEVHEKSNISI